MSPFRLDSSRYSATPKSSSDVQRPRWLGQTSVGWYFGFKLHLIINSHGELLAVTLTPGNTDDRKPVPEMTKDLVGKLFSDRGYVSQTLFEALLERRCTNPE